MIISMFCPQETSLQQWIVWCMYMWMSDRQKEKKEKEGVKDKCQNGQCAMSKKDHASSAGRHCPNDSIKSLSPWTAVQKSLNDTRPSWSSQSWLTHKILQLLKRSASCTVHAFLLSTHFLFICVPEILPSNNICVPEILPSNNISVPEILL